MKSNMSSVGHNCLFILLFQLLATCFGINRPSSGHYLQKLKNAGAYIYIYIYMYICTSILNLNFMGSHEIDELCYMQHHFKYL